MTHSSRVAHPSPGLPRWLSGIKKKKKKLAFNTGGIKGMRVQSLSWERSHRVRKWPALPVFLPEEFRRQSLVGSQSRT